MVVSKSRLLSQAVSKGGALDVVVSSNQDVSIGIKVYQNVSDLPLSGEKVGNQAFVEENQRLYIFNGYGWYSVSLVNQTPTFDSGFAPFPSYEWDASSPLTIKISATDPEYIPITYSATISDSSQYIATLSQDSGVFTFTPFSFESIYTYFNGYNGSFTSNFKATDGVNIASVLSQINVSLPLPPVNVSFATTFDTGLQRAANGDELLNWAGKYYTNLPDMFNNAWATNGVNNSNSDVFTLTVSGSDVLRLWLARQPGWSSVSLDGFTLHSSSNLTVITGYSAMDFYYRDLTAGTYGFEDYSAMYFLTDTNDDPNNVILL